MPSSVPTRPFERRKASHAHPRIVEHLDANGFFNITVTFQTRDNTAPNRTPSGGYVSPSTWTNVPGLVDIPARRSVPESSERQANERTVDWGRIDTDALVIALNGFYPQAKAGMRIVTSDGLYAHIDLRGVVHDSERRETTVTGRVTTPGGEGFE